LSTSMRATALRVLRPVAVVVGILLVSILAVVPWMGLGSPVGAVAGLVASELLGVTLLTWGSGSPLAAAIIASVVNVLLLVAVGTPESGALAGGLAFPKYALYLGVALWGARRERRQRLRWLGVGIPGGAMAYILVRWAIYLIDGLFRR
jgi:hypothetical protein